MQLRVLLKVVAILEIAGGVIGLIGLAVALLRFGLTTNLLASAAVGVPFFLLAIFAGVMLWQDRASGYSASAVVQLPQLVKVATPQFAFMLGLGGDLSVMRIAHQDQMGRSIVVLRFHSHGGSYSTVEVTRPPGAPRIFGIGIIPFVALVVLRRGWRPAEERKLPSSDPTTIAEHAEVQPDWVLPFWLKVVLGLFALLMICCTGLCLLPAGR